MRGLDEVRSRVEQAAKAAGRDPSSVRLVAVSKLKPSSAIREAYAACQRDFGENYAQELAEKATELASALAKRSPAKLRVLVEVNVAGEAEKHGVAPANVGALLDAIDAESNLQLGGFMTMPPHDLEAAKRAFEALVKLREQHGGATRLPELSMGMSDDLEIAIACGATLVRVGTAIFGAR